eukprot:jgi/Picre1/32292/NNA_007638.t1
MEAMKEGDANLIGQFGVGFYSAFLVADKVTVQTKSNDDPKQWCWESTAGSHSYTIKEDVNDIARGMAPFDQQEAMQKSKNIRLYVKRVFISDEFDEDLMPRYLSFVKGVVDSADLPLNVSREILQESRVVRAIKRQLVKRTLNAITAMAEKSKEEGTKDDTYITFWEAFGRNIKLGVLEDEGNRQVLAKLLRFSSNLSGTGYTSLEE